MNYLKAKKNILLKDSLNKAIEHIGTNVNSKLEEEVKERVKVVRVPRS